MRGLSFFLEVVVVIAKTIRTKILKHIFANSKSFTVGLIHLVVILPGTMRLGKAQDFRANHGHGDHRVDSSQEPHHGETRVDKEAGVVSWGGEESSQDALRDELEG